VNILYVRRPKGASGRELIVRTDEAVDDVEEAVQEDPAVWILLNGIIARFLAGVPRILNLCNFLYLHDTVMFQRVTILL